MDEQKTFRRFGARAGYAPGITGAFMAQNCIILGKWQKFEMGYYNSEGKSISNEVTQDSLPLEFFSNNTLEVGDAVSGNWTILNDGRIKMDLGLAGMYITCFCSIENEILIINSEK
jgi:hypothetical protein